MGTTINTTDIAIVILDAELFKVQELIDVDDVEDDEQHEEEIEDPAAAAAIVEPTIDYPIVVQTTDEDSEIDVEGLADDDDSDIAPTNAEIKQRKPFGFASSSSESSSSSSDHKPDLHI